MWQPAVKGLDAVIFLYLSFVIQTSLIHNANLYDCLNMLSQEINTLPIHTCECGDYVHECHHLHREHFQCFLTSGFLAHLRWYHLGQMSHPTHCFSCPILKVFSHSAHELVSTLAHAFFLAGNGCTCSCLFSTCSSFLFAPVPVVIHVDQHSITVEYFLYLVQMNN